MLFTFIPTQVFAAGNCLEITPASAKVGDEVTLTYTAQKEVNDLAAVSIRITFDSAKFGVTAVEYPKLSNFSPTGSNVKESNTNSWFSVSWTDEDAGLVIPANTALVKATLKVKDGGGSSSGFNVAHVAISDAAGTTLDNATNGLDKSSATVTIAKAPIASVTASVEKPEAGAALDFGGTVASGAPYSITKVEWFEGTNASGTPVTDPATAKAEQFYYARIALTANTDETFAASLDGGMVNSDGYAVTRKSETELYLTKVYETGSLPPASVTAAPTAKSGLKYNGSAQDLLGFVGTATNGTMQYSLNGTDWIDTDPMGKNAGDYTVYYKAKGDSTHSDSAVAHITATIGQKDISGVTIGTIASQPYTGSAITPDPVVVTDGTATLEKDKDYTVSCAKNTYVGTADLTITGTGNYTGTKGATFTITAIDQTPTFTTPVDLATGGATLDLRTLVQDAKGDMIFTIASGTAANLSGHELTSTGTTGVVKISVSITAKDVNEDSKNEYNAYSKSEAITVNVIDKTPASVTTAPEANTGLKYDGSEQKLVTEGAASGGNMQYSLGSSPWSAEIPTAKDAATYTVQYKVVGDSAHTDTAPVTLTVTIDPREVTVSGITAANKAYDGGTDATVNASGATFAGIVSGDNLTISPTGTFANADVGNGKTVNLTLGALGGTSVGNYKLAAGGSQTTTTANITPRDLIVTPNPGQSKTFGAADPTLHSTTSGKVPGQIPDFTGALSRAEGEDAGLYDITLGTLALIDHFSSGFKASNYTLKMVSPAVKFEITKAAAPAAPTGLKGYKDRALSTVTLPTGWSWVDDTLKMDTIGDQIFKANYAGDTNHQTGSNVDVTVKVVRRSSGGGGSSAAVAPDMPLLRYGSRGDAVKILQEKLNAKGYSSGNVDGIFGTKTRAAVISFQKANGLGVDGIVGKLTWAKLYDAAPVSVVAPAAQPMLRSGSRGEAVRKLQELLNARGYDCGAVDGIFGVKTRAAVIAFQKANGLSADGIVGPLTWGKLI